MGVATDAGDLPMCGTGQDGRLGLGDDGGRTRPTLVLRTQRDDDAELMVASVYARTAAVTEGGGVNASGDGSDGHLGHGDEETQLASRRVPAAGLNGVRVVMVAAGFGHTGGAQQGGARRHLGEDV